MKKCLVVLTGIMALMLLAPMANASYINCQTIGSTPPGTVALGVTQPVSLSCSIASLATLIPTGDYISGVDIQLFNDAQGPAGVGSELQWNWTNLVVEGTPIVGTQVNTETSTAGATFDACAITTAYVAGDGCGPTQLHYAENLSSGTFTASVNVAASVLSGDGGVDTGGNDSVRLKVQFDYSSIAPEPATMSLIGIALLGLGVFGSKKLSRR